MDTLPRRSSMGQEHPSLRGATTWRCFSASAGRASCAPRRAWLTLSMFLETACRRPRALRHAVTLALMHKHFYEYVRDTSRQLDALILKLRESESAI